MATECIFFLSERNLWTKFSGWWSKTAKHCGYGVKGPRIYNIHLRKSTKNNCCWTQIDNHSRVWNINSLRLNTRFRWYTNQGLFSVSKIVKIAFLSGYYKDTSHRCPIKQLKSIVWFRYDLQLQVQSMFQQVTPQGALLGS